MPNEISKEDYYSTPDATMGDNEDKIVSDPNAVVDDKPTDTPKEAPKADVKTELSEEELEKLKQVGGQKPEGEKPSGDKNKQDAPAVQEYEIEVAEDSPLTDEDINEVVSLAEKKGWTKEESQAEISRRESLLKRGMSAGEYEANKIIEGFKQEVNNHPLFATREIREESMTAVNEAVNRFASAEFKERFEKMYKDDIHILTMLHRIGKPFVQSGAFSGKPMTQIKETSAEKSEEGRLKELYPENF